MKKLDRYTVTIEDWTNQGQGVTHVDKLAIFVEGALPGDEALIEIDQVKKNFAKATCRQIINPSPDRREPPCLYSAICDGCKLIGLDYQAQLRWKKSFIENAFKRLGKLDVEVDMRPSPELAYRNKVNMRVDDSGRLSYSKQDSNQVFYVNTCVIAQESIQNIIHRWNTDLTNRPNFVKFASLIKMVVIRSNSSSETMIIAITDQLQDSQRKDLLDEMSLLQADVLGLTENEKAGDVRILNPIHYASDKEVLEETLSKLSFLVSPQSFFQVNRHTIENLYDMAISLFNNLSDSSVIDLYSGTGTTSLLLAQQAKQVISVELVPCAVEDAKENAKRNNIDNVSFIQAKAEDVIQDLTTDQHIKKALVDPPRKGLDRAVIDAIGQSQIDELVYISCNPTTQARDAALLANFGFAAKKIIGLDQFPNTSHVETVVLLSQQKPSDKIEVDLDLDELDVTSAETKATYAEIKEYVLKEHGMKVSSLYISQVKRKCGLEVGENYNLAKSEDARQPNCPEDKEKAIVDALKHFEMFS